MSQIQVTGEAKIRDLQGPVVANSGVITALDGLPSQYVRGDGTLADIPSVTGGGASVSYYLNGSVNQGTFGGSTYYQLGENAITGVGTNFSTSTDGLLAQFITDVNVPDVTEIPSGNWNIEFYMGVSASSGALASFYVEIYKYDGTTFTLVGTNVATPEFLTNTTTVDAYFTSVAMPLTAMAETDRIAIRVYANVASKTVTMYTEDNRLCQIVTTFSRGMLSLNSLTDQQQYLTVGTAGTDFNIVSAVDTHTFNIPVASATNTGKLSSADWSVFNAKQPALTFTAPLDNTSNTVSIPAASSTVDGYLDNADWTTFNNKQNAISLTTTGTSGAATFIGDTLNIPQYQGVLTNPVTGTGTTNTLPKFTAASTIGNSNITDTGSLITLGSNSYVNGSFGVGVTPLTQVSLRVNKNVTGNATSTGISQAGTVQSDVTVARGILNTLVTQAAVFTLPEYWHFQATQSTIGSGNIISNQIGYYVDSTLIGATNNYAFRSDLGAGTNRWNLYMNGTAANYMAGKLNIGTTSIDTNVQLHLLNSTNGYVGLRLEGSGSYAGSDWTLYASSSPSSSSNDFLGFYNNSTTDSATAGYKAIITKLGRFIIGSTSDSGATFQVTGTATISSTLTASSLIKSGGTAAQILAADGSVITAGTGISISGGVISSTVVGGVSSFNTRTGAVTLSSGDVTGALGFTPYNATNPSGYITSSASITGTSAGVVNTVSGTNSAELVRGNMADNDQFRILVGGTATNAGYAEIATADDGTEPIYVRQYTGTFSTLTRTLTLLDGSGNTTLPGTLSGTSATFSSSVTAGGRVLASGGSTNAFSGSNNSASEATLYVNNANAAGFGVYSAGGINYFSGNVGIGTSSPGQLLTLGGPASPQMSIISSTTTGSSEIYFGDSAAVYRGAIIYDHTSDYITLHTAAAERMRITSSGNVLIGTTTDAGQKLQVNGMVNAKSSTTSAGVGAASFMGAGEFVSTGSLGGFFFENRSGGVTSSSNWYGWYATSSTVHLYNGSSNIVSISNTGSITAQSFFESSDKRLKKEITDNPKVLEIESIKPKLYVKNDTEELGYYAQDFQEILPSAVTEGKDGFLSLSYSQVHTAKIAHLENEIAELKELIKTLIK